MVESLAASLTRAETDSPAPRNPHGVPGTSAEETALDHARRRLATAGKIRAAWALIALAAMLTTWTLPRTTVGLLLAVTVLPVAHLAIEGILGATLDSGPVARFHARVERHTEAQRISPLRILVCLAELLVLGGIGIALCLALAHVTRTDMAAVDAFLHHHFWP